MPVCNFHVILLRRITLFSDFGILVFVTLLATYACDTSGSKDNSLLANKRFLLDGYAVPSHISLEQFASCYLTCTPTYGKLLETCCKSGLSVVCSNLPWDILKPKLGSCSGLSNSPTTSAWVSLEQFAACFLTCVVGFEKLTEACCQTGLDAICTNLPWEILKSQLGSCRSELSTSTTTKPSTLPQPYWSSWGTWTCGHQGSICFQTRERKCSTGVHKDCESRPGEIVRLCSESTCPDFFSTKITRTTATTTRDLLYGHSTSSKMTSLSTTVTIPTQTGHVTATYTQSTPLMTSSLPPTTPTTSQQPNWLPWGIWLCEQQSGACYQRRERNCSTGMDNDCIQGQGGKQYNVGLCTKTLCPEFFKRTTTLAPTTTQTTTAQNVMPVLDGKTFKIYCAENNEFWHYNGAGSATIVSSLAQPDDSFVRFIFHKQLDGSYKIESLARPGVYMYDGYNVPGASYTSLHGRVDIDDDNMRYIVTMVTRDTFRIQTKASGRYVRLDEDKYVTSKLNIIDNRSLFILVES